MRLARLKYIVKDCRIDRFRQKLDLSPIVVTIADVLVKTVPNRYFKGTDWSRQKKVRPSGFEDYGRNQKESQLVCSENDYLSKRKWIAKI